MCEPHCHSVLSQCNCAVGSLAACWLGQPECTYMLPCCQVPLRLTQYCLAESDAALARATTLAPPQLHAACTALHERPAQCAGSSPRRGSCQLPCLDSMQEPHLPPPAAAACRAGWCWASALGAPTSAPCRWQSCCPGWPAGGGLWGTSWLPGGCHTGCPVWGFKEGRGGRWIGLRGKAG